MENIKFYNTIDKINNKINKNSFSIKSNFIGFIYNIIFMLIILQSILLQATLNNYIDNTLYLMISELFVFMFFVFDYFITFFSHIHKYKNAKFSKRYLKIIFSPFSLIQIVSIFASLIYIIFIYFFPSIVIDNPGCLLAFNIFQCIRLVIIFKFTKFTKLFIKVFKRQYNLIIGWFIYLSLIILIFGFIFHLFTKSDNPSITLWQSIYYSVIVVTTIGIGDIHAGLNNIYAQIVTVIFGFVGGASYALLASIVFSGLILELKLEENSKDIHELQKTVHKIEEKNEAIAEIIKDPKTINSKKNKLSKFKDNN